MKYTKEHEWLRVEGDLVVVGITEHAATQLGDVVFVELPEPDTMVAEGDEVCVIESVKAASDILAPVDGEIVAVSQKLVDNPGLVNEDPTGAAWFFTKSSARNFPLSNFTTIPSCREVLRGEPVAHVPVAGL